MKRILTIVLALLGVLLLTTSSANAQFHYNPNSGGTGVTDIVWSFPSYMTFNPGTLNAGGSETVSFNAQTANFVFAGPVTGSPAAPTFRALVVGDLPTGYSFGNLSGNLGTGQGPSSLSGLLYDAYGSLSAATPSQINTLIQTLSGCNTSGYVYTPQAVDCVAQTGGGTVSDGAGTTTTPEFAESTSAAHVLQYRTPSQALSDMGAAAANPNQTPETASFTAVCGNSYRITSGTVTVSLPSSGATGCLISVQNVSSNSATISSGTVTYNGPASLAQNQNTLIQFDGTNFNGSYPPTGSGGSNALTGTSLTAYDAYYMGASALALAEANASTTVPAICVASSTTACVFSGVVTNGSWTWTQGGVIYVSDSSAGGLTQTAPSTSGHFVQVVGVATSSTTMLVMPSLNVAGIQ